MPALIAWLLGALESVAGSIVISALLSLGFSFVSYHFAVAPLRTMIQSQLSSGGSQFVALIGFLGIDQAITMILSAIAARFLVAGASHLVRTAKASPPVAS